MGQSSNRGARAWAVIGNTWDGYASPTLINGYGISSVSTTSRGARVDFSTAQPNANYAAICTGHRNDQSDAVVTTYARTTTYFLVDIFNTGSGLFPFSFQCVVFGN